MNCFRVRMLVYGLLIAIACSPAEAALTYSLEIEVPKTVVRPAETLGASLVLREISDGVDDPAVSLRNGSGVAGFSARIFRSSGDAMISNLRVVDGFNFFGANPSPNPSISPTDVQLTVSTADFFSGVGAGSDRSEMVLATFDITVGGVMESIFQVGNLVDPLPNPLGIGAPLGDFREVNASSIRFGSLSVTAVPEPGGLLALSVLGLGGVAWYRRRSVVKGTATMV